MLSTVVIAEVTDHWMIMNHVRCLFIGVGSHFGSNCPPFSPHLCYVIGSTGFIVFIAPYPYDASNCPHFDLLTYRTSRDSLFTFRYCFHGKSADSLIGNPYNPNGRDWIVALDS